MIERPRRNRVTPFGNIEVNSHRGTLMGNRGDLHNDDGTVCRTWMLRRWISCTLHSPTGRRVTFDTPGCYTPLFFADEVTALAAGHRPCASCRRPAYEAFRAGWQDAFGEKPSAVEMDDILHQARINSAGQKVTFKTLLRDLPNGVFVACEQAVGSAFLVSNGKLFPWSHLGYGEPLSEPFNRAVKVLTPAPVVGILKTGLFPISD
ncbi:hypothetical protein [Rhizobium laguerreae]|uniref:hypothetical protein n=1 Tax=Rhizobium laguerreae TaxID=1076926 RepID=UPI001C902528|nr:hypothetical protein [Rhizobium laguerreae]MBY3078444.1 hypothetical protein [Rhizobium laguerreae]MBY3110109.1 hypothetical protein [Rhizobium laguerreae]